ncbi:MAG TPA: polyribonucleotide nucleotidyltransferase [Candidatus Saccharimonadales bacterium]
MATINPLGKDIIRVEGEFAGRRITLETNRLAFQASGAVTVTMGETVVLGIVTSGPVNRNLDYFPLSIDYEEKMYAAGKISGSRFIKREGRPSEEAILAGRLIDRPIRPLFPKGYRNELQGIATVLSLDPEVKPDLVGMIAVSSAMLLAGVPFDGPVAGARIGLVNGQLVAQPQTSDIEKSLLDLVVAGTKDAIMMVEAGASEVDEATMIDAIRLAHEVIQPVLELQEELAEKAGVEKQEYDLYLPDESRQDKVRELLAGKLGANVRAEYSKRKATLKALEDEVFAAFVPEDAEHEEKFAWHEAFDAIIKKEVRRGILEDGERPDGRKPEEIRPLSSEVGVLPRAHGSSIFTRGTTQAMNITTLAPLSYAQLIDTMELDTERRFIHHYNMPGYTVGEVRRLGSPGRREIGHGALAERGLRAVIPSEADFPYTIRTVSEILSSNGSTSMASVCSGCLSLMDAGVPIKAPVSGIAMGLVTDGTKSVILSDIQGTEDFAGDMDFKVVGTSNGITALQMDIKVKGIAPELMSDALAQAKAGRAHILEHMLTTISEPRAELSPYAPRIEKLMVNPDKIGAIIGKGGETINKITSETGAEIDIKDDGLVTISAVDADAIQRALNWVKSLVEEPEVGKVYEGTVVKIMEFGAFVNIMPGIDGMVHISQLADRRVEKVTDVLTEGQKVRVKLTAIDERGRLNLTMKDVE